MNLPDNEAEEMAAESSSGMASAENSPPAEKSQRGLMDVETPALLLDWPRVKQNLQAMSARMEEARVDLQPHMKTAKAVPIAREAVQGHSGGVTVSTLREAEILAEAGFPAITWAAGLVPQKLARVNRLLERFPRLSFRMLVDHPGAVAAAGDAARAFGRTFSLLIEIDSGQHRAGLLPTDPRLPELARRIHQDPGLNLAGVLTHAGHSYAARNPEEAAIYAEQERLAVVGAAGMIGGLGLRCPVRSVGATPTAMFGTNFTGVTEARPGVYMFMDVFQAQIGCCALDDIALSVLTSVIGIHQDPDRILIDAGALALSLDCSTSLQSGKGDPDRYCGYGLVCDMEGRLLPDLYVEKLHQEHGFIASRNPARTPLPALSIGEKLRILPIHACMTAAGWSHYILTAWGEVTGKMARFRGW